MAVAEPVPSRASSRTLPGRRRLLAGLALLSSLATVGVGCRSLGPLPAPPGVVAERPWEVPASALGTQRLFRARYSGPEGDGSFHLTMRLESEDRVQIAAADRLGGRLWALDALGGDGIWIDYRQRTYCRRPDEVPLLDWGPAWELQALPRLLLGRLPVVPVSPPPAQVAGSTSLNVLDARGRQWTGEVGRAGVVTHWAVWEAGEASWWWRLEGREASLFQHGAQRELRWQEVAAEPLPGPLDPLPLPSGYVEQCW